MLRQIELNTCIQRPLPLYDFSNIGLFYKSHWYKVLLHDTFLTEVEGFEYTRVRNWAVLQMEVLLRKIESTSLVEQHQLGVKIV